MKLPQLLSQYLYQTKRLDLPGIGSFTLDAGAVIPQESDRVGQVAASGIQFTNANIPIADDALINFLKEHTGKMKSLVSSDLDFFLTTGKQLLNIGKPFYLDGIGTLLKNKEGRFEFTPGEYLVTKLSDLHHPEKKGPAAIGFDEPPREETRSGGNNMRQTLLLVGLVGGLIVIAWGGYYLYKRNNYTEPTSLNQARVVPETTATKAVDTSALAAKPGDPSAVAGGTAAAGSGTAAKDTLSHAATANPPDASAAKPAATTPAAPPVNPPPVTGTVPVPAAGQSLYYFVILRTESKNHALRRYNQLLGYQLNIKLETKDSTFFKLYFPIAAAIKDTTHIRDSLADVYASHVTIEQH